MHCDLIWKEREGLGDSEILGRGGLPADGAAHGPGVKCITELGRRLCYPAPQGIREFSKLKTGSFTSIRW